MIEEDRYCIDVSKEHTLGGGDVEKGQYSRAAPAYRYMASRTLSIRARARKGGGRLPWCWSAMWASRYSKEVGIWIVTQTDMGERTDRRRGREITIPVGGMTCALLGGGRTGN
jgi:hypothetical protein